MWIKSTTTITFVPFFLAKDPILPVEYARAGPRTALLFLLEQVNKTPTNYAQGQLTTRDNKNHGREHKEISIWKYQRELGIYKSSTMPSACSSELPGILGYENHRRDPAK